MSLATKPATLLLTLPLVTLQVGCEEAPKPPAPAKPSAAVSAAPPPPVVSAAPPPRKLRDDCPKGSSGVGTSDDPCLASADARMMEVQYTGKTTDQGPKFSIVNKSDHQILYGSIAAFFYDKAGKQLQVTVDGKSKPMQTCSGNIFAGVVKPAEKIFMFFSCVKKEHVPEGTVAIEAELVTVGFADESGKKNEYFWSNPDLAPKERPKGGIKAPATKK